MKSQSSFFKGITRNIFLLGIVSLFTDLSSQMVFPLIPLYLTTVLGAGAYTVGIVEGAAESTASILKVASGYWSDRIGRRKPFIILGYSLSSFTKPLFAFAHIWEFVFLVRIIERIGKGLRTAPRDAIIAESSGELVRGKAFGFNRAADGIGSILGASIAFGLLNVWEYEDIFLIAFVPGIMAIMATLFVMEPAKSPPKKNTQSFIQVSLQALPANLRIFIIVSAIFAMGHFGYAFLLLKAMDIGLADKSAILLYIMFYLIYTLCAIPSGALSDKIGRKPMLMFGYSLFALVSLGLVFTSNTSMLLLSFGIYGIFFAMIDGAQRAFVVDLAPAHLKATALGTFHTAIGLTALPGGFIAGMLWDEFNPEATFIYGLALAVISVTMFFFVKDKPPEGGKICTG